MLGLPYKDHRAGDLNNGNLFPHSPGGWKSEVKVSVGLVSSEVSLLGLEIHLLSVSHMVFPLFACVLISSYKNSSLLD